MKKKERLVQWMPVPSEPRKGARVLPDDWAGGLEVKVVDPSVPGKGFSFRFDEVLSFRSANESFREMLLGVSSNPPCRTFKVEDSEWLESFHEKTFEEYQGCQIQHFVFVSDVIIEVLAPAEPRIVEIQLPCTSPSP